jgi:chemotaxis protein methyltransferase CheR
MSISSRDDSQAKKVVARVSQIVSQRAGIQLGDRQFQMVKSRLGGRIARLKIKDFDDYMEHLEENLEEESHALVSLLTTHHTFFFREFAHFEFMLNHGLERMIARARERGDRKIRVWSAAASRGQEAYSLAMFFNFHLSVLAPDVDFEIWGTDVDPDSVKWAKNGVYKAEELKQAPAMYVNGNWIRGKDDVKDFSKVKSSLKGKCFFQTANILDCRDFLLNRTFDLVFCRNVFIYFEPSQIKQCTQEILKHLDPKGFLVLGVSESINGLNLPAQAIGPSTYQHPQEAKKTAAVAKVHQEPQRPLRVLCVDDSPIILVILKKILDDNSGFQVVATANNGLEALEILKTTTVDVITLDLHMPEMDGLGFLKAYQNGKAPVVVVSSVNRDDKSIAQQALSLGASDYIEKPSLENISQASNELRSKLKTVISLKTGKVTAAPTKTVAASPEVSPKTTGKKRVLIVDDSATIRQLLEKIISLDPELEVVGKAEKPSEVEALIRKTSPDLITLDIHMPEMDGISLLKKIQPQFGIPTVMISSISKEEGPQVMQALELGAIDYIQKPEMNTLAQQGPQIRERLKAAIKAGSRKKVLSRKATQKFSHTGLNSLVLLGASTGGTEAIRVVLESLPSETPPILIVQHIPGGFSTAFAKRLNELVSIEVKEANDGDEVRPNRALVAPGGMQMSLKVLKDKVIVQVTPAESQARHNPSVDVLFRSVLRQFNPSRVVAVLMTGMGKDGALGMKELRDRGASTIAQDKESSVVFGMPREAIEIGAAQTVCTLSQIGQTIVETVEKNLRAQRNQEPGPQASKKIA